MTKNERLGNLVVFYVILAILGPMHFKMSIIFSYLK